MRSVYSNWFKEFCASVSALELACQSFGLYGSVGNSRCRANIRYAAAIGSRIRGQVPHLKAPPILAISLKSVSMTSSP